MTVRGVRVADLEELVLTQEALLRERVLPELEWDESEASLLVEEVVGESRRCGREY
ncbi:MAG TPA: hypothetical protein VKF40_16725 [Burkholderiales bacterium]|nr:hypothetical protein [Burkholderiales bacterium]